MHPHRHTLWLPLCVASVVAIALVACQRPYSAGSYAKVPADYVTATICHGGKRTINVPAEEWPEHRAHGDYRGPCRTLGHVPDGRRRAARQTATSYRGHDERLKHSRETYASRQARLEALRDSLVHAAELDAGRQ